MKIVQNLNGSSLAEIEFLAKVCPNRMFEVSNGVYQEVLLEVIDNVNEGIRQVEYQIEKSKQGNWTIKPTNNRSVKRKCKTTQV